MKPLSLFTVIFFGALYLCNCALAAKVVAYNVTRILPGNGGSSGAGLSRRGDVNESLFNNLTYGGYMASVQVGTPYQTLNLQLSTGSSDIWVLDETSSQCSSSQGCITPCKSFRIPMDWSGCSIPSYNLKLILWPHLVHPNKSQTISTVEAGGFKINYVDGTQTTGDWIQDHFAVGSTGQAQILLQIGLGVDSSTNGGIMGYGSSL